MADARKIDALKRYLIEGKDNLGLDCEFDSFDTLQAAHKCADQLVNGGGSVVIVDRENMVVVSRVSFDRDNIPSDI